MIQRIINSKLFFNKSTLVNQLKFISYKEIEDGPIKDRSLNTIRLLEKAKNLKIDSKFCVTVYDINPAMMKIGQEDSKMMSYNQKFVRWVEGDIQKLPFEDGSFDAYLLFFGIRQNIDFNLVFKEANRVLKSNGKIVIGEFCYSKNPTISQRLYIKCMQYIGYKMFTVLTKDKDTYKLFLKNVINLPSPNQTVRMLEDAGFKQIQFKPMSWKIAGMYVGYKM